MSYIFFVIIEMVLSSFEFVFSLPDIGLDKLKISLIMSLSGDVCGLRVTCLYAN